MQDSMFGYTAAGSERKLIELLLNGQQTRWNGKMRRALVVTGGMKLIAFHFIFHVNAQVADVADMVGRHKVPDQDLFLRIIQLGDQ